MNRPKTWILMLMASIWWQFAVNVPAVAGEQARVTTSFDSKHTAAVLTRVAKALPGGFTRTDADQLVSQIKSMKADQPMTWDFRVNFGGTVHLLQIRALLDDLGMVDLDFLTTAELAPTIRMAVDSYLNERSGR